jgi:hypothetical protein
VDHAVHVDDIKQQITGTKEEVMKQGIEAGTARVTAIQDKGFTISSKSCIISSSKEVARSLQKYFRHNLAVQTTIPKVAEHLGHARTHRRSLVHSIIRKRFAKASKRVAKIRCLAKQDKRAARLFRTGANPMATYEASVIGLCPTLQRTLDAMAVRTTIGWGFQPDKNCVLNMAVGTIPSVEA